MVEKYLLAPEGFFCYLALFAAFFAFFWWRRKDWRIAFIITFGIAMPTLLIPALATATSSKVIEPMFSQLFWGYISIFPMHVIGGALLGVGALAVVNEDRTRPVMGQYLF